MLKNFVLTNDYLLIYVFKTKLICTFLNYKMINYNVYLKIVNKAM